MKGTNFQLQATYEFQAGRVLRHGRCVVCQRQGEHPKRRQREKRTHKERVRPASDSSAKVDNKILHSMCRGNKATHFFSLKDEDKIQDFQISKVRVCHQQDLKNF